MESIIRDVAGLDETHRRAMEDVLGRELLSNQRLIISVTDVDATTPAEEGGATKSQSIDDWKKVYEGLADEQIEAVDGIVKARANLTRFVP